MNLAMAAVFRNEAPYLREWIEFHLCVGFEHFYLFDNLSADRPKEALQPYLDRGLVEYIFWPHDHADYFEWNEVQCLAYRHALEKACGRAKWLAILDVDEFLFSADGPIFDILQRYRNFGGVAVNWQVFGTSNLPQIPPNKRMIEMLNLKMPSGQDVNRRVKSIVRPECVKDCDNPHSMVYYPGHGQVNTAGVPFEGKLSPTIETAPLRINHYTLRDEHFFTTQKLPRLQKWWGGSEEYWRERRETYYKDMNQVEDKEIHRFLNLMDSTHGSCDCSRFSK